MQVGTSGWGGEAHPLQPLGGVQPLGERSAESEMLRCPNHSAESEMLRASSAGDGARVGLFLAAGCPPGVADPVLGLTPLHLASRAGSVSTVRVLLEAAGRYPERPVNQPPKL